jgi:hypothetical protein
MKSDMDNREWLDDYSALKQVSPDNPFTVPSGYFDELEQRITSCIHLEELKFGDEGFTVPENYFDELSTNIQSRIAVEEMAGAEDGFAVPEGYFENLTGQISAKIQVEEALQKEGNFNVPEGYFESLNQKILAKTINADQAKKDKEIRRGVVRKLFATTAFKYAAAACFAVVIGATVLLDQSTDPLSAHNNSFLHKQISTLPVSDIKSYLQDDVDAGDVQHTVIDENAPVNDAKLNNALNSIDENNIQ